MLRPLRSVLSLLAALALVVTTATGVGAASPSSGDRVELVRLSTAPPPGPGSVGFHLDLRHRLESVPNALLVIFLLEDGADPTTQDPVQVTPVSAGNGTTGLNVAYQPRPGAQTLSIVAALFKDERSMLTWVLTRPLPLAPSLGRASFDLGLAALQSDDPQGARSYFSQAIELAPNAPVYYYWRGDALVRLGEYDLAIADYSRVLELAPADRAARTARGVASLWKRDWDTALRDLDAVVAQGGGERDPWLAGAHRARGLAFAGLGDGAHAIAEYEAYLQMAPNAPDRAQIDEWITALR
jgi:tetratricopeptide (TPR) repeat protein